MFILPCLQRLCLLRAGTLKPRPVPDTKTKLRKLNLKLHVTPACNKHVVGNSWASFVNRQRVFNLLSAKKRFEDLVLCQAAQLHLCSFTFLVQLLQLIRSHKHSSPCLIIPNNHSVSLNRKRSWLIRVNIPRQTAAIYMMSYNGFFPINRISSKISQ